MKHVRSKLGIMRDILLLRQGLRLQNGSDWGNVAPECALTVVVDTG